VKHEAARRPSRNLSKDLSTKDLSKEVSKNLQQLLRERRASRNERASTRNEREERDDDSDSSSSSEDSDSSSSGSSSDSSDSSPANNGPANSGRGGSFASRGGAPSRDFGEHQDGMHMHMQRGGHDFGIHDGFPDEGHVCYSEFSYYSEDSDGAISGLAAPLPGEISDTLACGRSAPLGGLCGDKSGSAAHYECGSAGLSQTSSAMSGTSRVRRRRHSASVGVGDGGGSWALAGGNFSGGPLREQIPAQGFPGANNLAAFSGGCSQSIAQHDPQHDPQQRPRRHSLSARRGQATFGKVMQEVWDAFGQMELEDEVAHARDNRLARDNLRRSAKCPSDRGSARGLGGGLEGVGVLASAKGMSGAAWRRFLLRFADVDTDDSDDCVSFSV